MVDGGFKFLDLTGLDGTGVTLPSPKQFLFLCSAF